MATDTVFPVLLRFLHIWCACLVTGSIFFTAYILPAGLGTLDAVQRQEPYRRSRAALKVVLHACILLLILSGTYNAWANWGAYRLAPGAAHSILAMHIGLALAAIGLIVWATMGARPEVVERRLMRITVLALVAVVAAASTLKRVRERAGASYGSATSMRTMVDTHGAPPVARGHEHEGMRWKASGTTC